MKEVARQMIKHWHMTDVDWMGYILEPKEYFSFHHLIIPKRDGGEMSEQNGAILISQSSHPYLHLIETKERLMFEEITWLLIEINQQRYMPTKQQLIEINNILKRFEKIYGGEKTYKGELLIKERYLRRIYNAK